MFFNEQVVRGQRVRNRCASTRRRKFVGVFLTFHLCERENLSREGLPHAPGIRSRYVLYGADMNSFRELHLS